MRLSHKHKFILISIQKTASMTLRVNLNRYSDKIYQWDSKVQIDQHMTAKTVKKTLFENDTEKFNSYFKFAFVRNPWDRTVSWYENLRKVSSKTESNITEESSLGGFKKFICSEYGGKFSYRLGYDRYYEDDSGNNLLDFIGKFENLQEDFNFVCDKIGIPRQQLPHKNKSKHRHYTEYYDEETKQMVAEKFAKDIEYFNYNFGE